MAGYHGITGWSGGGRRPLTYNLMPGQMRSTRVNVFQSNYIMPMATSYYAEPHCHCEDSGMPKWMQWMMGIGMGSQLLGGIMSGIFGGGGSTEGAGGVSEKEIKAKQELKDVQDMYTKYNIKVIDGKYCAKAKDGKSPMIKKDSLSELMEELEKPTTPTINHGANKLTLETITTTIYPELKGKITYNETKGEFVVGGKSFKDLKDAIAEAKKSNTSVETDPTVAAPKDTGTVPKLFNDVSGKTAEQVLNDFKNATNADAVKIEDIGDGGITITNLHDPTQNDKNGSCTITSDMLKGLKQGELTKLNVKYAGQDVYAENLDGYLRIKVGSQTYIVGKADNKYTGYQFENGNVDGYNARNPELSGGG